MAWLVGTSPGIIPVRLPGTGIYLVSLTVTQLPAHNSVDHPSLQLTFLGGAAEIGASSCLLQLGSTNLLIDAGIRFKGESKLPDLAPLQGLHLDAILVTHAHTDHTGALPVLSEAFPATPIYATAPTIDLVTILTRDALKLMNSGDAEGDIPLYSEKQVEKMQAAMIPQPANQRLEVGEAVIHFFPASHILGAAMIHLETPTGNLLFTGDYNVTSQRTVPALTRPALPVDMVITESTYGNRLHEERKQAEERLLLQIRTVLDRGGKVLVPAFAIGRAQEILLILKDALRHGRLPEVPVFVDGMVRSVCEVYRRHENWVCRPLAKAIRHDDHPFYSNGIQRVGSFKDREKILSQGACVIVASSGMLTGGASAFYASKLAGNELNAILLTGYQDEESPGSALLKLADPAMPAGKKQAARSLKVAGKTVNVGCTFATYGLSAHADRLQMVALLEAMRPRTIVLVHGDAEAKIALAGSLSCRDVISADNGTVLQRSFRKNRRTSVSGHSLDIDLQTARNLLGPPGDVPLRARQVGEAWFGRIVSKEELAALVSKLEELGLVVRDDERRSLLWVLAPGQTDCLEEEASLEAEMKEANYKGKLLEMCMRAQAEMPVAEFGEEGAFHTARLQMVFQDTPLDSDVCHAAGKKTAEQMAAKVVLDLIEKIQVVGTVHSLSEDELSTLRLANPKGKLLEWQTKHPGVMVDYEHRVQTTGLAAQVRIVLPGGLSFESDFYCAAKKKMAQQGAAAEGLKWAESQSPDLPSGGVTISVGGEHNTAGKMAGSTSPQITLNEMRQNGIIKDFGFRVLQTIGPSHQPVFVMEGWVQAESGPELKSESVQSSSKKQGKQDAARALMKVMMDAGMCGGETGHI